ncbi:MAG: polysaccharide export protein [Nitrospira sp.]|nr:polysaccharide export protein [Nitrospira sp.]
MAFLIIRTLATIFHGRHRVVQRPSSLVTLWMVMFLVVSGGPLKAYAEKLSEPLPRPQSVGGERGGDKSSLVVTPDYIIGPEDVLDVSVWKNTDLSRTVVVRPDGKISLPLIGDVVAVGMTATQLADVISDRLREYKENPQVSIVVKEINSYAIYVLGEVAHPGKYPLKSKTTLLQAITLAGGFTPTAVRNKIVVFRFGENGQKDIKIKVNYDDIILRDGSSQNLVLAPGDTIVIPSETMVLVP